MRVSAFYFLLLLQLGTTLVIGQNLQKVRAEARQDLQNATQRLAEIRDKIESEKIPIVQEVSSKERETAKKKERP